MKRDGGQTGGQPVDAGQKNGPALSGKFLRKTRHAVEIHPWIVREIEWEFKTGHGRAGVAEATGCPGSLQSGVSAHSTANQIKKGQEAEGVINPVATSDARGTLKSSSYLSLVRMNSTRPAGQTPILGVFQSKEQTRAFYNKISGVYDLLSERSEAPMRKAGLELLKAGPGERVLEIGFGTGHSLVALAKAVGPKGKALGLDLSDKMAKIAKENLAKAGLLERAALRCGDAAKLPYAAENVDAVFMSFALELFDTPEIPKVLQECKRVLKPGGRIVVVGMSREAKHDPLLGVYEWAHKHFPNFVDCRPIYVREALESAGFKIQKALVKHMWVPVEIILGVKT